MYKALYYKEWIKTRRVVLLMGILFAACIIYTFINLNQILRVSGEVQIWGGIIMKDAAVLPVVIKWLPLLAGVLLGLTQFIPEMENKRLKLTLHLPLHESRTMATMLCYGIVVLLILYSIFYLFLLTSMSFYFPGEMISGMFWKTFPWFLGGFAGYLFAAWVCIEPLWRQRIINSVVSVCGLFIFYIDAVSGAYRCFIPILIVLILISFSYPFYSTARFKEGAQK